MQTIGQKLSPILKEIEDTLWEYEFNAPNMPPNYDNDAIKSSCKILISVMMDKMWNLQHNENMDLEDRINMTQKLGEEVRSLVKTYTGLDTHDFYK